jgi:hypothetical protein
MAYDLGFSNVHDRDQSITPAVLAERDPKRFAAAAQASSMRAMDMSHNDILAAASHVSSSALPKTRRYGRGIGRE